MAHRNSVIPGLPTTDSSPPPSSYLRQQNAAILLGADRLQILAIFFLGKLHSLSYSREEEAQADLAGADVCASAGYNPSGLVWLFQDFQNAKMRSVPQIVSDHPNNQNRVNALKRHFRENPAVFAKFNPDPKSATPISVPKNAPETFLR